MCPRVGDRVMGPSRTYEWACTYTSMDTSMSDGMNKGLGLSGDGRPNDDVHRPLGERMGIGPQSATALRP